MQIDSSESNAVGDSLNFEQDPEILKALNEGMHYNHLSVICVESVMISLKVHKFNYIDWKQERNLVVTDKNIFNFKGKSILM